MATRIDVEELISLVERGATLIDVLPEPTYQQEHLPGATSIPLQTFHPDDVISLDRDSPVVLYCFDQHCDLSARASRRLEAEGFTEVYDLVGGRASWTALGLPTEGSVGDRRRIVHYVEPAVTVAVDATIAEVTDWSGPVAVVTEDGALLGSIDSSAGELPGDTPVARAMAAAPGTIRPELRIEEVAERLRNDSLEHIFVTTVSGVLLGIVFTDPLHA